MVMSLPMPLRYAIANEVSQISFNGESNVSADAYGTLFCLTGLSTIPFVSEQRRMQLKFVPAVLLKLTSFSIVGMHKD